LRPVSTNAACALAVVAPVGFGSMPTPYHVGLLGVRGCSVGRLLNYHVRDGLTAGH
jgi:hypothetical protein